MPFSYDYPTADLNVLEDVEDTLVDWELLENTSMRQGDILMSRMRDKIRGQFAGGDGNSKAT